MMITLLHKKLRALKKSVELPDYTDCQNDYRDFCTFSEISNYLLLRTNRYAVLMLMVLIVYTDPDTGCHSGCCKTTSDP